PASYRVVRTKSYLFNKASEELCHGVSRLPNGAGLIYKVLANDSTRIKKAIRDFWQTVRQVATGYSLPAPFLWKV
ncbi:hypothetical protein QIH29_21185, partial [Klebsiella pneumoniae]|nr:hypothetical protein [Klebsiella pneumoniae]